MDEKSIKNEAPIEKSEQIEFKKPVLFGRVGKLPKKVKDEVDKPPEEKPKPPSEDNPSESSSKNSLPPAVLMKELSTPIPYKEPKWSGLCPEGSDYALEVLKSGVIVEKIDLTRKSFYVFGRLANCDVVLAHPSVSRHHAVLQYKAFAEEGEPPSGWYIYDLGSTHGTSLNKQPVKPHHYTRVRPTHLLQYGNSSRAYIMMGPDFDCEEESELTVTEIKQRALELKLNRDKMIEAAKEQREKQRLEEERKREEQGIDWGMGEDAEEETDLSENPYASTANEELYLADPKKTLRGYFEREGHELTYSCEERGVGQFLCRVELPLDDSRGRPVVAEVLHRGKKKEAVVACALEACRQLDRAGLLRQAKHESRRRKQRDWSADDYYDSDDDSFLDRTGAVESKRRARMRHDKQADQPLTYQHLIEQIKQIENSIASEEEALARLRSRAGGSGGVRGEEGGEGGDALDEYMTSLGSQGQSMADKAEISKTKMSIQKLNAELNKTRRLADAARPADVPPLIKKSDNNRVKIANNSVVYGKRIRLKEDIEKKQRVKEVKKQEESEFVEEMDSDEEEDKKIEKEIIEEKPKLKKLAEVNPTSISEDAAKKEDTVETRKIYGPMRPPENYVIPEDYFNQTSDRDLPEITDDNQ